MLTLNYESILGLLKTRRIVNEYHRNEELFSLCDTFEVYCINEDILDL